MRRNHHKTSVRNIVAFYSKGSSYRDALKITRSVHARSATMRAFDHMQIDEYGAALCEVYDESKGVLHAVFKRTPMRVEVIFRRNPKDHL